MSNQREITYSIGETEKLTGASQKQIRYWEKKGFIPKVERNIYPPVMILKSYDVLRPIMNPYHIWRVVNVPIIWNNSFWRVDRKMALFSYMLREDIF